jgi:hypothetical protein
MVNVYSIAIRFDTSFLPEEKLRSKVKPWRFTPSVCIGDGQWEELGSFTSPSMHLRDAEHWAGNKVRQAIADLPAVDAVTVLVRR